MSSSDVPGALHEGAVDACALAFNAARQATGRGALERYKKAENIDPENVDAVRAATERFRTLPLLLAPELHALALEAATEARGPRVAASARFSATIWMGGATDTYDGRDFLGNFADFVHLLENRAQALATKRNGWVIEPTTNPSGRRTNEATVAMHALFLDCDGRGDWFTLLDVLNTLDYAYIAYESGGHSISTPKWRVVLFLSQPFSTDTDEKRAAWKAIYHHCRVTFGVLGKLLGEGFDPMTDTPCCPWFLTERRDMEAPPRKIRCRVGHSLDLMSLAMALPPVDEPLSTTPTHRVVTPNGLSDEQFDAIITALSKVTANIPSGRHELYLALPGVMLDRGVAPDEVLNIIEAVSASYPRIHADKHADNLHNARTTIGKWENGGAVTRIGTLNDRWPEIAQALDEVLPNPFDAMVKASTTAMLAEQPQMLTMDGLPAPTKKKRRKLSPLGKEILPIVAVMKVSTNAQRRFGALLIDRILDGDSFQMENSTPEQVDGLVAVVMNALGFNLPATTTWRDILDLANHTLLSMDFTQSVERVAAAEKAFLKGQRKKRVWIAKREAAIQTETASNDFFKNAAKKNENR